MRRCDRYNLKIFVSFCSRTLTSVYDAILEDLVFPAEIVGKRIRIKLDGKQIIKVHLDKTQQTNIEHKVIFTNGRRLWGYCSTG